MKKTIINKHNYKEYLQNGKLIIGDYKKVKLEKFDNLNIIAKDCNNIKVGNNCTIKVGNENKIKCGEFCQIKGSENNSLKIGSNCEVSLYGNSYVEATGKNIKLEFEGNEGESSFYNDIEDSVILTYNLMNKMKIYRSNDLTNKKIIPIKDGVIHTNYTIKQ